MIAQAIVALSRAARADKQTSVVLFFRDFFATVSEGEETADLSSGEKEEFSSFLKASGAADLMTKALVELFESRPVDPRAHLIDFWNRAEDVKPAVMPAPSSTSSGVAKPETRGAEALIPQIQEAQPDSDEKAQPEEGAAQPQLPLDPQPPPQPQGLIASEAKVELEGHSGQEGQAMGRDQQQGHENRSPQTDEPEETQTNQSDSDTQVVASTNSVAPPEDGGEKAIAPQPSAQDVEGAEQPSGGEQRGALDRLAADEAKEDEKVEQN